MKQWIKDFLDDLELRATIVGTHWILAGGKVLVEYAEKETLRAKTKAFENAAEALRLGRELKALELEHNMMLMRVGRAPIAFSADEEAVRSVQ